MSSIWSSEVAQRIARNKPALGGCKRCALLHTLRQCGVVVGGQTAARGQLVSYLVLLSPETGKGGGMWERWVPMFHHPYRYTVTTRMTLR